MIEHIIRQGEKIKDICNHYDVQQTELKSYNQHVTNWDNIIPGTMIKIPIVSKAMNENLRESEPFVEDYYPKNDTPRPQGMKNSNMNALPSQLQPIMDQNQQNQTQFQQPQFQNQQMQPQFQTQQPMQFIPPINQQFQQPQFQTSS